MQTRAWILHCLYTVYQLGQMGLGKGLWQKSCPDPVAETAPDEICPVYNSEFLDPLKPALKIIITCKILLNIPIDIACYKLR